jgi:hypothetical protein
MKKVVLIFPDTTRMAEFILMHRITKAETNSIECSLSATTTDQVIEIARKQYGAKLRACTLVRH